MSARLAEIDELARSTRTFRRDPASVERSERAHSDPSVGVYTVSLLAEWTYSEHALFLRRACASQEATRPVLDSWRMFRQCDLGPRQFRPCVVRGDAADGVDEFGTGWVSA